MILTRTIFTVGFFLLLINSISAAVCPKDSSAINYSTVYFEDSGTSQAVEYELFLYSESSSENLDNLVQNVKSNLPAFWVSGLEWGKRYFWHVKAYDKDHRELSAGKPHTFSIIRTISNRHEKIALDIKTNKTDRHAGGLISLDYTRCIFNRQGQIVWTLPNIPDLVDDGTQIRDLQLTSDNTITFLTGKVPVETDLTGKVLWRGPAHYVLDNDTISYHHDFRKTTRGTYMVLGSKRVYRKVTETFAEEPARRRNDTKMVDGVKYKKVPVDLLLEFDAKGKLIWFWDADKYITDADLNFKKTREGYPNFSSHANAFSENESATKVYIGFRDLNRIVKLDKKTKKVELTYGQKYPSGDARFGDGLFKSQHDANVTSHNSIFIFNNNGPRGEGSGISSILELKDNVTEKDSVLLWRFDLDFDSLSDGRSANQGNVVELPNTNVLLCAGAINRIFEVTKNKEVVWDAFVLSKAKNGKTFDPFPQYRCHWMLQLNEYHFIVGTPSPIARQAGTANFKIAVSNTGNADDSYLIEIYDGNKLIYKKKSGLVVKQTTQDQALSFKLPAKVKQLTIKVSSTHSKDLNSSLQTTL